MTLILRSMKKHMGWEDANDDYAVLDDEKTVGRIYRERGEDRWLWSVNTSPFPAPPPNNGLATSLEESETALQGTIRGDEGSGSETLRISRLAAGHGLPTLRLVAIRRCTDGAGGFFLMSIRCRFRRSPRFRRRPSMLAGTWRALSGSSWCPDTNSSSRSAPASAALRRAWRRSSDSITTTLATRPLG
jgi:hypothetical protein